MSLDLVECISIAKITASYMHLHNKDYRYLDGTRDGEEERMERKKGLFYGEEEHDMHFFKIRFYFVDKKNILCIGVCKRPWYCTS